MLVEALPSPNPNRAKNDVLRVGAVTGGAGTNWGESTSAVDAGTFVENEAVGAGAGAGTGLDPSGIG